MWCGCQGGRSPLLCDDRHGEFGGDECDQRHGSDRTGQGEPDAEEHHAVGDQAVNDVRLGECVVEVRSRDGHGDDEDEVEEELE
jgi:hypothetical protein